MFLHLLRAPQLSNEAKTRENYIKDRTHELGAKNHEAQVKDRPHKVKANTRVTEIKNHILGMT